MEPLQMPRGRGLGGLRSGGHPPSMAGARAGSGSRALRTCTQYTCGHDLCRPWHKYSTRVPRDAKPRAPRRPCSTLSPASGSPQGRDRETGGQDPGPRAERRLLRAAAAPAPGGPHAVGPEGKGEVTKHKTGSR